MKTKICPKCDRELPVSKFYRDASRSDGYAHWCKVCCEKYQVRYRKTKEGKAKQLAASTRYNTTEKGKANAARYWASEKGKQQRRQAGRRRRARRAGVEGFHTRNEFVCLCKAVALRCLGCDESFPLDELTEDHIVPLSLGGDDNIENIQPLCGPCNSSKGATVLDFRE